MMWFWSSGYGWSMWVFGAVMMLVLWVGVAWLIVTMVTSLGARKVDDGDAAMEALRQRLARGGISAEEFERLRQVLARRGREAPTS